MSGLICDQCGELIKDLAGKVVVDRAQYQQPGGRVDRLQLACDRCFLRLADHLHRMWELRWLKDHSLWVSRDFLTELGGDPSERAWSPGVIQRFLRLGAIVPPDPLQKPPDT